MTKKTMLKTVLACSAAGMLVLGGTSAYLTDREEAVNEFVVGKVDIELTEPNWKPEDNKEIVPTQEIKKDPKITNTGINSAFVYLEIAIPKANVICANPDGSRIPAANTELFTFTPNENWTLLGTSDSETQKVYTYAFDQIVEAGDSTNTLFDEVTFANVIEGQLETRQLNIPVHAYAIQSLNTGGDSTDVPAQAKEAYQKYLKQNA
ncbi:MAG: SipW-dependent-type signal peptide-containing protein [Clostridiales bacterium]|nr:SipW-dependent-type signal peptide-containing protein [Candidatus Blautia equi]